MPSTPSRVTALAALACAGWLGGSPSSWAAEPRPRWQRDTGG